MGETHHPHATEIKKLFQEWHVRGAILMSLFLQVLLLLLATYRKRTSNSFMLFFIYAVYQLSSMVANAAFALVVGAGLFATAQMPFGLWAAFMLLHMAGQERLTAYSLEDCDAWLTSFLGLVWRYFIHFVIVMFHGSLPLPTAIISCIAFIRLLARMVRLRLGTLEMSGFQLLQDPNPLILNDNVQLIEIGRPITDVALQVVLKARCLLGSSLRLVAGIKRRYAIRIAEQLFFLSITDPRYAIRIVEAELNLMYDSFYTDGTIRKHLNDKYSVLYVAVCSCASICCFITLIAFINSSEKHHYFRGDYIVTCILLWGTLILEFLSYLMKVFSDWTVASLGENGGQILLAVIPHRQRWWSDSMVNRGAAPSWAHVARIFLRRWSETISKFNLLFYSIKQPVQKPPDYVLWPNAFTGITRLIRNFEFVSSEWYADNLGIFITIKLQGMGPNTISFLRDEWGKDDSYKTLVLQLHIVTEVLYNCDKCQCEERQYSKLLSDYMAYLLFMKPRSMSRIRGNPSVDVELVCTSIKSMALGESFEERLEGVCNNIFSCQATPACGYDWAAVFDLAKDAIGEVNGANQLRWSGISSIWVELLLYAASEIDPVEHIRGLSQGGELASLVWLLAFHLGFF